MSRYFFLIFLYTSMYSIISVHCCQPAKTVSAYNSPERLVLPNPELKFPGASDEAVRASEDAIKTINTELTSIISSRSSFTDIPYENILGKIYKFSTLLTSLLPDDDGKSENQKLTEHNRTKAAVLDIKGKLELVVERLKDFQRYSENGTNFDDKIDSAAELCKGITLQFCNPENYLLNYDNVLFTAPALITFVGIYAGVAGINFLTFSRANYFILVNEMVKLDKCVMEYQEETLAKRLSYVRVKAYGTRQNESVHCEDDFARVTSCESCPQITCKRQDHQDVFANYKASVTKIYRGYFDGTLSQLEIVYSERFGEIWKYF